MHVKEYTTYHLVKSEDLNHHGTLYAGRTAEWFVESGFTAAASLTHPDHIVCLQIHGMVFKNPVKRGEIACFKSKVVFTGRTKIVAYIALQAAERNVVEGFITFIHVDENGRSKPHGIEIIPETEEDIILHEKAKALFPQNK
ncbi:MAG: acyl-CoA thioesterase [Anaerolineaceae bacterium]|nr:acyl-CoA thioesterase [Anaerolineaceae bacterium]